MKKRFLPIGTVVRLEGANKYIMITSYCIIPTGTEYVKGNEQTPKRKMYEYGGCVFPMGIMDTNVSLCFNHKQIAEIIHLGLENEDYKEYSKMLNSNYDDIKEKYEQGTLDKGDMLNNN